jgi:hypothetical protein
MAEVHLKAWATESTSKIAENQWPIDWQPDAGSFAIPGKGFFPGLPLQMAFEPNDKTCEFRLEPGWAFYPDQIDLRRFKIKYGDDVSCWDYSPNGNNIQHPPIHGTYRIRWQTKFADSGSTPFRYIIKRLSSSELPFIGEAVDVGRISEDLSTPLQMEEPETLSTTASRPSRQRNGFCVRFESIRLINKSTVLLNLSIQNTTTDHIIASAMSDLTWSKGFVPGTMNTALQRSDATQLEYVVSSLTGIRGMNGNPQDLTPIPPGTTLPVSIEYFAPVGSIKTSSSFRLKAMMIVDTNYDVSAFESYPSDSATMPPQCRLFNLDMEIPSIKSGNKN